MKHARQLIAAALAVGLVALAPTQQATAHKRDHSDEHRSADASVVSAWNDIAIQTLTGDTTVPVKAPIEGYLYTAFMHAAVYNAVVGIEGRYEPYRFCRHAPRHASSEAAAVAAAYTVLLNYSSAKKTFLDGEYAKSLATIRDGKAKTDGIAFGKLAAADVIAKRVGDRRNDPGVQFNPPKPEAAGVWRPTLPSAARFSAPWLGFVKPLLLRSGAQFDPGPPPSLTSRRYAKDFNEVKDYGSAGPTTKRTPEMTANGLFYAGNPIVQLTRALRDQAAKRHLDIVDSARMFAAVHMSLADASIAVWYTKFTYGLWRPVTAIQLADTDGNGRTEADPTWVPAVISTPTLETPPYPDYVSGYNGIMGAFSQALEDALGTRHLQLVLTSTAAAGSRTYDSGDAVRQDVIDARVWLGIHFRFADTSAARLGQQVAHYGLEHNFQPVDDD